MKTKLIGFLNRRVSKGLLFGTLLAVVSFPGIGWGAQRGGEGHQYSGAGQSYSGGTSHSRDSRSYSGGARSFSGGERGYSQSGRNYSAQGREFSDSHRDSHRGNTGRGDDDDKREGFNGSYGYHPYF